MLQWKSNMDPKKIVIERLKFLREAQKKIDEIMRRDNIVESLSVLKERQKNYRDQSYLLLDGLFDSGDNN